MLHSRLTDAGRSVAAAPGPEEPFRSLAPDPLERVSLDAFLAAARSGLFPTPPPEVRTDHVAPIRASVRDAVETILALLPATGAVRFRDLTLGVHEKLEVIVRFLAVLELFKQGVIDLEQSESFADLIVLPARARRARRARPHVDRRSRRRNRCARPEPDDERRFDDDSESEARGRDRVGA